MMRVLLAFGLALAVAVTPLAALAHTGHDHGAKTKKVKKPRAKNAAAEFVVLQRAG